MKTRIKEIREEKGISQKELARRLKISPSTLSQIERPDNNTQFKTIERIAEALDCHPGDLIAYDVVGDHRVYDSGSDFDLAWKAAVAKIEKPENVTDDEYNQFVWEWALQDLKTNDDRIFIKNLSKPALKLNASGRNLLLQNAELYATYDYLTKSSDDHGNEEKKED